MCIIGNKYTLIFLLITIGVATFSSCVPKHKFDNSAKLLPDTTISAILTDVFIMESYVAERLPGNSSDTMVLLKQSFYSQIIAHHKVDSLSFYNTFNFLQSHPKALQTVLVMVDSAMQKIKPGDSSVYKPVVELPKNIENIPNFKEQQKILQEVYKKNHNTNKLNTLKERHKGI